MQKTSTLQRKPALLRGNGQHVRVEMLLDCHGHVAADVGDWMARSYPHLRSSARAQPGLAVALTLPADSGVYRGWRARLTASLAPVDLFMEIMSECLADLGLAPSPMVGLHVTAAAER